jgi:hypothetical protein
MNKNALEQHILECQVNVAKFYLSNATQINRARLSALRHNEIGKPCPICGEKMSRRPGPSKLTIEHIVPVSCGGDNSYDGPFPQCVAMCELCNKSRNQVVLSIGSDGFGAEKRITPEAIRFLITQVYGKKEDLDQEMLKMFSQRNALVRSRHEATVREIITKQDDLEIQSLTPPPVVQSRQKWWNPRTWFGKRIPRDSQGSTSSSHPQSKDIEKSPAIYLNLTKEETLVQFEKDLITAIADVNYEGDSFHSYSLVPLYSAYGGGQKLREKLGMQDEDIDTLLIHYFPTRFIVQNAGVNKIIHILEDIEEDIVDFEDDLLDFEMAEEDDREEHVSEESEEEEQPPLQVSMKIVFLHEKIRALLRQNPTGESRISFTHILDAITQLRDDNGDDWDSFFESFDSFEIDSDGSIEENIEKLLSLSGFEIQRIQVDTVSYLEFSLPHDF